MFRHQTRQTLLAGYIIPVTGVNTVTGVDLAQPSASRGYEQQAGEPTTMTTPDELNHQLPAVSHPIDLTRHPITEDSFQLNCKVELDTNGVLVLPGFLTKSAIQAIAKEGETHHDKAFFTVSDHNVYLKPHDPDLPDQHARNRAVSSSKGCITTDQIPAESPLMQLYNDTTFKSFLCSVLNAQALFEYADPLSSVNLHYAAAGQELGWHFDNSSFAITLLIQKPDDGGVFEYVKDLRDAAAGDMNYEQVGHVLDGDAPVQTLSMDPGCLVLFRGRNSLHRVTPTRGETTRMLAVLAYNTEQGVSLSESARMTFYGRLG